MERKIGEIFEYNGEWYQCIEGNGCADCSFNKRKCSTVVDNGDPIGDCCADRRKDNKEVIFKKLEKVGDPFSCNYYGDSRLVMMQEYQLFDSNVIYCYQTRPMYITDYKHKRIAIEIKQNKEDMEEKKIQHYDCFFDGKSSKSNLKPFDLKAAKAGKPVCTRGGRKARIIYFDAKGDYPIVALIETGNGEKVGQYMIDGHCTNIISQCCDDLMMLPEKKEGWVNVYKERIYSTKEEAIEATYDGATYVDTVKVCWEE